MCTAAQHDYILRLLERITEAKQNCDDEVKEAVDNILSEIHALPSLRGQEFAAVDRSTTSKVIDALKLMEQSVRARSAERVLGKYPGLVDAVSVMTTKFRGKCAACNEMILPGVDLYVTFRDGTRKPYCVDCASESLADREAQVSASREALKQFIGLHKVDNILYRVLSDGSLEIRKGRYWNKTVKDPGLSQWTLITGERAQAYGLATGKCIHCGDDIGDGTSRRSLAMGYGPVCAKQYGWYFPKTEREAEEILANRIRMG